jgi:hypothetical protein
MKDKEYLAVTMDGLAHIVEAPYYEKALKKANELYYGRLVAVVERDTAIDSPFLKLVTGKFNEKAISQEAKGIVKYGVPLNPMDDYDWLNMADDELIDGYKYFVAERTKRDTVLKDVMCCLTTMKESLEKEQNGEAYIAAIEAVEFKLRQLSKNI